MSEAFVSLAREVFASACVDGAHRLPTATTQLLESIGNGTSIDNDTWDSFEQQLREELPIWRNRWIPAPRLDEADRPTWETAVRAVSLRLRHWNPSNTLAFDELSVLLHTLNALGLDCADIEQFSAHVRNDEVVYGLGHLIAHTEVRAYLHGHERIPNAEREIKVAALEGNYLKISHYLPHMHPEAHAVLWAAVRLLWRLDPAKLAETLTSKDSVYLALLVQHTLDDDFASLALRIPIMWLKYASIHHMESAYRKGSTAHDWAELLRQLLVQAADTHAWSGWMNALMRAPQSGSLITVALPKALVSLQMHHWDAVLAAVHLSHSRASAEPMARMLSTLAQEVEETAASSLWSMCFDRWDQWNFGKNEPQTYLFAPTACALDYPVAMHYANMASDERDVVEATLKLAVETIEQQWFESATDLITERNRLLSRLRVVSHGRMLANGETNLLPPAIKPPDAYTSTRYHYFDAQARL